MNEATPIEHNLLTTAATAELTVTKSHVQPTPAGDDWHVVIEGRIGSEEGDDVEWAAFGVIFALGVLSFHDAKPRGLSEKEFFEVDEWSAGDMLRSLQFARAGRTPFLCRLCAWPDAEDHHDRSP